MNPQMTLRFLSPPAPYFISCNKAVCHKGEGHPNRHNIGVFDLIVVCKGHFHIGEGDYKFSIKEGQYLILHPNAFHYSIQPCEEETEFYWVHFQTSESWREVLDNEKAKTKDTSWNEKNEYKSINEFDTNYFNFQIPKFQSIVYPDNIYNKLDQLVELQQKTLPSDLWSQQLIFQEILREFYDYHAKYQNHRTLEIAELTANFLKQNYKKSINNKLLHKVFHFHPNYITRCMHEVFDCTPLEYLANYRMERAKILLLDSKLKISEISEEVGFEEVAYFTRRFRKHVGTSPLQYRKKFIK